MTTKCLKINDSIIDPTGGAAIVGVCVEIAPGTQIGKGFQEGNPAIVKIPFDLILNYYRSEADLNAAKQPIVWTNLPNRVSIKVLKSDITGLVDTNSAVYAALKTQFLMATVANGGLGFVNVTEILE